MATPRGPNLKIQPFTGGKNEDFKIWLTNEFLLKASANNWPEASRAQILPGFLTDHALFVYQGLPQATKDDYDTVVEHLEAKLLTAERKRFNGEQYQGRAQRDDEDVDTYARELSKLATSATSYMTVASEREINLRDKFINGLRPSLRTQVRLFSPETLEHAIKAAELAESVAGDASASGAPQMVTCMDKLCKKIDALEGNSTKPVIATAVPATPAEATKVKDEPPPWAHWLIGAVQKLEAAQDRQAGASGFGESRHPSEFPMYDRQTFTPSGRMICQMCNKAGHTAARCPNAGKYCNYHGCYGHATAEWRAKPGSSRPNPRGFSSNSAARLSDNRSRGNMQRGGYGDSRQASRFHPAMRADCVQQLEENTEPGTASDQHQITTFVGTVTCDDGPLDLSFRRSGCKANPVDPQLAGGTTRPERLRADGNQNAASGADSPTANSSVPETSEPDGYCTSSGSPMPTENLSWVFDLPIWEPPQEDAASPTQPVANEDLANQPVEHTPDGLGVIDNCPPADLADGTIQHGGATTSAIGEIREPPVVIPTGHTFANLNAESVEGPGTHQPETSALNFGWPCDLQMLGIDNLSPEDLCIGVATDDEWQWSLNEADLYDCRTPDLCALIQSGTGSPEPTTEDTTCSEPRFPDLVILDPPASEMNGDNLLTNKDDSSGQGSLPKCVHAPDTPDGNGPQSQDTATTHRVLDEMELDCSDNDDHLFFPQGTSRDTGQPAVGTTATAAGQESQTACTTPGWKKEFNIQTNNEAQPDSVFAPESTEVQRVLPTEANAKPTPRHRRRGCNGGRKRRQWKSAGPGIHPYWLFMATCICLVGSAGTMFPNPMICETHQHKQLWRIPASFDCSTLGDDSGQWPTKARVQLYKRNVIQYVTEGWLCRKATTRIKTFTYFFNDENLKRSESTNEMVNQAECNRMKTFKKCANGDLAPTGTVWATNNKPDWHYPGGGIRCCRWKMFQATNCFLYEVKVYKRHGASDMESTAGDVSHCNYENGHCTLDNGRFLLWQPSKNERCAVLPWKEFDGSMKGSQWLADDGTLALTFADRATAPKLNACNRTTIRMSDQVIPFRIISQETPRPYVASQSVVRRRILTRNGITRHKRDNGQLETGIVSSELLAGSLQALEIHMRKATAFSFHHAVASSCNNMKRMFEILRSSIMGSPTLALRLLLNHTNIVARSGGEPIEVWPCVELKESQFKVLPMNNTCTQKIPIQVSLANATHVYYLDTNTNILGPWDGEPIGCDYINDLPVTIANTSFIYQASGELSAVANVHNLEPLHFQTDIQPLADVVFHPVIMYHLGELQSHISLNDMYKAYHQQRQILTMLGMQTGSSATAQTADEAAAHIVSLGLLGFLKGLGLDPIQLWIFGCCVYVTATLCHKLLKYRSKGVGKLKSWSNKLCRLGSGMATAVRNVTGYGTVGTVLVTTLDTQSKLNLSGGALRAVQATKPFPSAASAPFRPYQLNCLSTIRQTKGTIPIVVNGTKHQALFDTGAEISLMSSAAAQRSPAPNCKSTKSPADPWRVASGKGHLFVLEGSIKTEVSIGSVTFEGSMLVAKSLPYDVILGQNIIKQMGAVTINLNERTLTFDGDSVKICANKVIPPTEFVTNRDFATLDPNAECIIRGKLNSAGPGGQHFLIEPLADQAKRSVMVATAIVVPDAEGCVPLRILNPSQCTVKLFPGMRLAEHVSLSREQLIQVDTQVHASDATIANIRVSRHDGGAERGLSSKFKDLDLSCCSLDAAHKEKLVTLLQEFQDVFSEGDQDLQGTSLVQHRIQTGEAVPIRQKAYRSAFALRDVIRDKIQDMLKNNIIEYSTSEWASPIVMVKKKDGSWRFCVDYRKLNAVTRKDSYPMKRVDDVWGTLDKAKYFCTLDLQSGYHQIPMASDSKHKTAFVTSEGLFEYRRMPFGLCNAPATFQRLMERVLAGLDWRICLVYLDDILIMGATGEELLDRLRQVLLRLRAAGLKLKPKKCAFGRSTVPFLGHILSKDGLFPECAKVDKIRNWPVPTNAREVQAFLGLAGYYRQFVWCFAKIAAPLHALTKKESTFAWDDSCQQAFDTLKAKLTTAPVLIFPDFGKPFNLQTDASNEAVGAVLSQLGPDGKEHPISFASRSLNKSERRYAAVEKETLGVVWAVQHFRAFLYGKSFTVTTDHQPLRWLLSVKDPHGRLCRWSLILQEYDMTIGHRPGRENRNADGLSRRSGSASEPEFREQATPCDVCNEMHQSMLREYSLPEKTCPVIGSVTLDQEENVDWRRHQHDDPLVSSVIRAVETGETTNVSTHLQRMMGDFFIKNGILWRADRLEGRPKLFLPETFHPQALNACHDHFFGGHLGVKKTFSKLEARYYWPTMYKDAKRWCRSCEACASRKPPVSKTVPALRPIPVEAPWHQVACDIVGSLPVTKNGNKYIIVFADYFTKWIECFAMPDMKTERIAKLFVNEIVCRYGVPYSLLTDQAPNLVSEIIQETCRLLGVRKLRTSAYHPACDGLVERFNRTMETMISLYINTNQNDWDEVLPMISFAYRTSVHESTGASPFLLNFGREAALPFDIALPRPPTGYTDIDDYRSRLVTKMTKAWQIADEAIASAQNRQKRYHDRRSKDLPFMEGDLVYLHVPQVGIGKKVKLARCWKGPFIIHEISEDGTGATIQPRFNATRRTAKRVNVRRLKRAPIPYGPTPLRRTTNNDSTENLSVDATTDDQGSQAVDSLTVPAGADTEADRTPSAPAVVPPTCATRYNLRSRKGQANVVTQEQDSISGRTTEANDANGPVTYVNVLYQVDAASALRRRHLSVGRAQRRIWIPDGDRLKPELPHTQQHETGGVWQQQGPSRPVAITQRRSSYERNPGSVSPRHDSSAHVTLGHTIDTWPRVCVAASACSIGRGHVHTTASQDWDHRAADQLKEMAEEATDIELIALWNAGIQQTHCLTFAEQQRLSQRMRKIRFRQTVVTDRFRALERCLQKRAPGRQEQQGCLRRQLPGTTVVVFGTDHAFSPTYPCSFQVGHQWFTSADQCQRYYRVLAHGAPSDAIKIIGATRREVERLDAVPTGKSRKPPLTDTDLLATARAANWHKFMQNKDLAQKLLSTGTSLLAFHGIDLFWGSGHHRRGDTQHTDSCLSTGRNVLGKLLEDIREEVNHKRDGDAQFLSASGVTPRNYGASGFTQPGISRDPFLSRPPGNNYSDSP